MAKTDIAVAELIWNLMTGKTGNVSRTDFFPQKPAFEDAVPARGASAGEDVFPDAFTENSPEIFPEISLPRATPESQGISSVRLARFLKELAAKESTDIHQALVVRNGFVICECGFAPYKRGVWHASYSMCKSIVGDRFFPQKKPAQSSSHERRYGGASAHHDQRRELPGNWDHRRK